MLREEVKVGKCYVSTHSVRKILSIDDKRISYQFLYGPILKSGKKFSSTTIKSFLKWATKEIEELEDYSHIKGFSPQKNYTILNTLGQPFLKCQENRLKNYLKKELVKKINDDTYQFTVDYIEKKLLRIHNNKLPKHIIEEKHQQCVVCGIKKGLTRHHVIPKKDLKFYPLETKDGLSNRLCICHKHHKEYENIKTENSVEFNEYNKKSALNWMNHFIQTMKPKFMQENWYIFM